MFTRATITLNNLNNFTNFQKREYIENLVRERNYNMTDMFALVHKDTFNWTTFGYFDATALNYTDAWEEGTIHTALDFKTSNEGFEGTYGVRLPGSPNATRDLNQLNLLNNTNTTWPYNLFQNSLNPNAAGTPPAPGTDPATPPAPENPTPPPADPAAPPPADPAAPPPARLLTELNLKISRIWRKL
jgi:hypothetical protein